MAEEARNRKLSPIYDAIDARNFKGAIKLCQKKDIQSWDITKVDNLSNDITNL